MTKKILLIEDDQDLALMIRDYLLKEGYQISLLYDGHQAVEQIETQQPDVVILDVMLPGKGGLSICQEVRGKFNGSILMFTAKEDEIDQIVGLEIGADDYIFKPVKPRLLLAKIKSLIRRNQTPGLGSRIMLGALEIDIRSRTVTMSGKYIDLTTAEFDVLLILASNIDQIMSREDIHEGLSLRNYDGLDRSIDNKISSLRKKLGDDAKSPSKIKTIRSKGYLLSGDL